MIQDEQGGVLVTNDGATILDKMRVNHPAAKMLVGLSKAQDIEAGDGTTSVVVICGALLNSIQGLLSKGIHPTKISESFGKAVSKAEIELEKIGTPVALTARDSLINAARTSLSSKVISQYAELFAPLAVDAVLKVIDAATATNVDLDDVKIVTRVGGTMDDTEMIDGLCFGKGFSKSGGIQTIQNPKIALIQFCLSAPKTDMENSVVVSEYDQMDKILREERKFFFKKINKSFQNEKKGHNQKEIQRRPVLYIFYCECVFIIASIHISNFYYSFYILFLTFFFILFFFNDNTIYKYLFLQVNTF